MTEILEQPWRYVEPSNALFEALPRALGLNDVRMIAHTGGGHAGACYANVAQRIQTHGGRLQLGWIFIEWPGLLAYAVHHAVWETPHGELVDITGSAGPKARRLFAPDSYIDPTWLFPFYVPPKPVILGHELHAKALIEAEAAFHAMNAEIAQRGPAVLQELDQAVRSCDGLPGVAPLVRPNR